MGFTAFHPSRHQDDSSLLHFYRYFHLLRDDFPAIRSPCLALRQAASFYSPCITATGQWGLSSMVFESSNRITSSDLNHSDCSEYLFFWSKQSDSNRHPELGKFRYYLYTMSACGGDNETRTHTSFRKPPPQDGVSANSTISPCGVAEEIWTLTLFGNWF